jgi:hypothetical protein
MNYYQASFSQGYFLVQLIDEITYMHLKYGFHNRKNWSYFKFGFNKSQKESS